MNNFRYTINALTGSAVFLFTIELAEYSIQKLHSSRLQSKIFKDEQIVDKKKLQNQIVNDMSKNSYQPSYNSDLMIWEFRNSITYLSKTKINDAPIKEKVKDLIKQSYSLSKELDILVSSIDKNFYDILYNIKMGKHINDKINANKLNYNDAIKKSVDNTLESKHGIYISTFDSSNVLENIDDVSLIDEAKSFINNIKDVDDKFRIIPKNKIDTFGRSNFITVVDNNRNNDQKELTLKLIKERNKLIVDLTADFSNYFESILEQKDLLLLELRINNPELNGSPFASTFISLLISSVILDFFCYNRLQLTDWWNSGRLRKILEVYFGGGGNWKKGVMQTAFAGLCYFYITRQNILPKGVNDMLVPLINFLEEFLDYDTDIDEIDLDDNSDDERIKDVVISPVVVNNGTIYNPLSQPRLLTAVGSNVFDEYFFRRILFRSLLLGTNSFNAFLFSSIVYSLYKDPTLDLTCTVNEWSESQTMTYFLLKGMLFQALYILSGGILIPSIISACECINEHSKEFYKFERKELATSHELIGLYRQLVVFSFFATREHFRNFIQPADNSISNNQNNDDDYECLNAVSKEVMKEFNTVNKENNILTPTDFSDFMESFHHALLLAKYKNTNIDKIDAEIYEKDLFELSKLNLFTEEYLQQYTADYPFLQIMPFKDINNFKKISVNPIKDLQDFYISLYVTVGLREEELFTYIRSKIFHAGFTKITPELIKDIENELFKWHRADRNKFLDLTQLFYEGTLQGFDETMKKYCKVETEKFFNNTAGRPVTSEDFNEMEKRAFSFFRHPHISNLIKPNSQILQKLGCSHHNFHTLKFLRSKNDAELKKLYTEWEQYFAGPLFYKRMKKIVYDSMLESEKLYNSGNRISKE